MLDSTFLVVTIYLHSFSYSKKILHYNLQVKRYRVQLRMIRPEELYLCGGAYRFKF